MVKIGKVNINKTVHTENYSEGLICVEKCVIGRIKLHKNIGAMELQLAPPFVDILENEARDFYLNYSTLYHKNLSKEEIIALFLKTLLMLDELEDSFIEIVEVTECKYALMICYTYGISYLPSNSKEVLKEVANVLKTDQLVVESILLNESMFTITPDKREADDFQILHHLFS